MDCELCSDVWTFLMWLNIRSGGRRITAGWVGKTRGRPRLGKPSSSKPPCLRLGTSSSDTLQFVVCNKPDFLDLLSLSLALLFVQSRSALNCGTMHTSMTSLVKWYCLLGCGYHVSGCSELNMSPANSVNGAWTWDESQDLLGDNTMTPTACWSLRAAALSSLFMKIPWDPPHPRKLMCLFWSFCNHPFHEILGQQNLVYLFHLTWTTIESGSTWTLCNLTEHASLSLLWSPLATFTASTTFNFLPEDIPGLAIRTTASLESWIIRKCLAFASFNSLTGS